METSPCCSQPTLRPGRYSPHFVNEVVLPWGWNPGLSGSRGRELSRIPASAVLHGGPVYPEPASGFSGQLASPVATTHWVEWAPAVMRVHVKI